MSVPSGEAYAQAPVERPPPPAANDQVDHTAVLAHNSQPQQEQQLQQQQQTTTSEISDKLTKLSVQEPHQTQNGTPSAPSASEANTDPFGEWVLKEITWPDPRVGGYRRTVKVLTQNANGPCSLLALANVLILRGSIHISSKLDKISYLALSTLIADFLVTRPQPENSRQGLTLEAALNILPTTVRGLNVNVGFDDIMSFQATEEGSSDELALFATAGVDLVHGWLADKSSGEEWKALQRASGQAEGKHHGIPTYDGVQEAIIKGLDGQGQNSTDSVVLQQFLQSTATQLTFPGLFALNALEPGSVVAFFRNSHLSVLYRRHNPPPTDSPLSEPDTSPTLYQLVTDQSFAKEPEITWESIVDIDGAGTNYYNSEFFPASSAGGDYSGMSAGEVVRREERARRDQEREEARLRGEVESGAYEGEYRGSLEDHTDLQETTQLDPAVRARAAPRPGDDAEQAEGSDRTARAGGKVKKDKKGKKDCLIM
ncbi:hypothetical protein QFC19_004617 [Naganishia cerealis]|uniref:Uncharacterized protein n=1 Tax=Naganishia cerealis TaxID=610337 RepID=A0ACC2VWT6_9TREE|nr:hypothetical protein QFC19_004617 [Naganishia cerealis]